MRRRSWCARSRPSWAAILDLDWSVVSDERLLDRLRRIDRVERQIPAGRSAVLSEVKTRGLAEQHGCRTAAAFLRQLLNCSAAEAGSRLALADDLVPGRSLSTGEQLPPKLPALAAAVADGAVGAEHVRLIRHTMRRIPNTVDQSTRDQAEHDLVEHARTLDPDQFKHACARLLMCLDPDGSLGSTDDERQRSRAFTIGRQDRHGMYPVTGRLDPETGALLRAALEPLAAPRHTVQERDVRSVSQRMHDAVRDAAKLMLGSGELPSQAGVPATLLITARLDDLERKTGHVSTAHGGLIPVRDVLRMAANAKLVPAVFDTDGAPLWLGRANRLATLHQRHVLTIMDKGCVYPGCDVPATRCEVMHLHDWVNRRTHQHRQPRAGLRLPPPPVRADGHWSAVMGGCGAPHRCASTHSGDPESIPYSTTPNYPYLRPVTNSRGRVSGGSARTGGAACGRRRCAT